MPCTDEVNMNIKTNTPAFLEHIVLNALCRDRTPADVLRQYLKCGYEDYDLNSSFNSYRDHERPVTRLAPLPHPFVTACENGNVPVVKLFLLLGAKPDAMIVNGSQSPLEAFKDTPKIHRVLSEDIPRMACRFTDELLPVMRGQIEKCIIEENVHRLLFCGMRGLKVTDSSVVFTRQFSESSELVQAFVFRMLMSSRRRKAIAATMKRRRKSIPLTLQRALESDNIESMVKLHKLLDSAELFPEKLESMMISSFLSQDEQISLMRLYMEKSHAARGDSELWTLFDNLVSQIFRSGVDCHGVMG